ncbi:hypothetical protein O6H91_10G064900 [Diphasiastrum complanatum]|uniref:Uncharacterized protein n=2 Tax=Diphasiastrum complanatum TaxID=34168 RepID=A0ACC2CHP8_DIPCM|nr:hypothetical protein O6H91_Y416400 [Diphasiastrum complanatum]KAJ7541557.1 hypothetical protein O6H91_10G064900 [Diphasiastrum complanatum]KAJ7541558.1 hypothetical protein O6H91_10G064900 [Diphasiastrum complanatum]
MGLTMRMALRISLVAVLFTVSVADSRKVKKGKKDQLELGDSTGGELKNQFYKETCPTAEDTVKQVVQGYVNNDRGIAASLLRMLFHDCFVRGCEASVLLNGSNTEKTAIPNLSLRGFNVINDIKAAVEAICQKTVSCADILALSARDSIAMIGGPSWNVLTGRRDGNESSAADVFLNLPAPFFTYPQLVSNFQSKGLDETDLLWLSGAHTVGLAHCGTIQKRLYSFSGQGDTDPALDPAYAIQLKEECRPGDVTTKIAMDPDSELRFDTHYYSAVRAHEGLFQSDAALLNSPVASQFLMFADTLLPEGTFFQQFSNSMVKLTSIGVLTGSQGTIRTDCAVPVSS